MRSSVSSRRHPGRRGPAGFVLVMTLWVLAGIAIAVGLMTLWALDAVRDAAAERQRTDDLLAMHGTRDTVLYLAATRATTFAGLPIRPLTEDERAVRLLDDLGGFNREPRGGELRLDGVPYEGVGGATFQLQDEAGLFSLVLPTPADLDRFLAVNDVDPNRIPSLRDALLDYVDSDSLRRLNGAEARAYDSESRPPPANRRLLVPVEATRVLGWDDLPESLAAGLADLTTTHYGGPVNLNTVPERLLGAWLPQCDGEDCASVVAQRVREPFRSADQLELAQGVQLSGDAMVDYRFLPADEIRITLWGTAGTGWRIHVRFTPLADQRAPWSILAAYPVPRPIEHVPAQPTGSDLFADAPPGR